MEDRITLEAPFMHLLGSTKKRKRFHAGSRHLHDSDRTEKLIQ